MNRKDYLIKTINVSALLLCSSLFSNTFTVAAAELNQLDSLDSKVNLNSNQSIDINSNQNIDINNSNLNVQNLKIIRSAINLETIESNKNLDPSKFNRVASLLAQANPQETSESTETSLDDLNPNEDDLILPTTTEEVTINLEQPITIDQAIDLALKNNRDLREAELNVDVARKQLDAALGAQFPSLALQGTGINSNTATAELSNAQLSDANPTLDEDDLGIEDSTTSFSGDLTLNYDLYTGGNRGASIRLARAQLEINELALEVAIENTIFETKEDYYDLQDADSQVGIAESAVSDAAQTLKDAVLMRDAGLGTKFDVLRAEVELANAQQNLKTAESNLSTAISQLIETLSLREKVTIEAEDEIVKAGEWDLDLEESIITAYDNRQELQQFLLSKEINIEQKKLALSAIRPTVSVFGQLDATEVLDDDVSATTGYTVGGTLTWTIFDGGTAKANARVEDVNVKISENDFADQRNNVKFEVEQAYYGLKSNEENIVTAEKAVELATESLRLARLRFQAGVGTQTDVIEAQTELTTARGNRTSAIINYNQSLNQIERAVTGVTRSQG